ncbi:hypothetical protein KO361_01235 [Candidatus Woesearchaeota archaeon]|nr:hypothetical protein [Candidatus Woesearchaeota archaeon]
MLQKLINKKSKQTILVLVTMLIIFLINTAGANSPNVFIEPLNPYTIDTLICSFDFEGYDYYNINWYRNGEITGIGNSTTVSSTQTTKNETWTCEVTTYLGGEIEHQGNRTVQIRNSAPTNLRMFFANGTEIFEYQEITEDEVYNVYFNATDPDGDTLSYSITDTSERDLCHSLNQNTGTMVCEPTHYTLTGTTLPASESPINYTIRLRAEETAAEGYSVFRDFKLTIIPVNDQARFETEILDLSLNALPESNWTYLVEAYDEELNLPLNFSLSHNEGLGLKLVTPEENNQTTILLGFPEGKPTNADVGNWTVTIFVTDSYGSNESRPATNQTFNLQINRTSELPYVTTNLTNIIGTQGEPFELLIEARDPDENDTISFRILPLYNETIDPHCAPQYFEWNQTLQVLNNSWNNASALINITNLTNNHVICRMMNIELTDQLGSSSTIPVFFNITNVNDPPEVHELSLYEQNIGGQTNMSNLSVSLYVASAVYKVNATDPDQHTYDINNTGIITYTTNDSRFNINSQTGVMPLTFLNQDLIGNWEIEITATDNQGLNHTRIMNLEIIANQPPIISTLTEPIIHNQNDEIIVPFNTTDPDGDNVYISISSNNPRFNQEIYLMALEQNNTYMQGSANITNWHFNLSNWIINKTNTHPENQRPNKTLYANELVGTHNLTITLYDSHGASNVNSTTNLVFTVLNENDPPFFDMNPRNNVTDEEITFNNMAQGRTRTEILYATDFDLYLPNPTEELTYTTINQSNITIISFTKHVGYEDVATLTFVPNTVGEQFITVQVTDLEGSSTNQTINFRVYNETTPPRFTEIRPYFENGTTYAGYKNAAEMTNPSYIEGEENTYIVFDANIEIDPVIYMNDPEGEFNSLKTELYVNGELIETKTNVISKYNSSYQVYFDFFSEGINNITMKAIDAIDSSSTWTWQVNISNVNRPPIYCEDSLHDIKFSGSIMWPNYLGYFAHQRFYDPDDDPTNTRPASINPCIEEFSGVKELPSLTFSHEMTAGYCNADFVFEGTNLTIIGYARGMCVVRFTATDEYDESVTSEEVIIEILEAVSDGDVASEKTIIITETITMPIQEEVDVPAPTKIIYPGNAVFYQNQTIEIPIEVKNNWTTELSGITLSATTTNNLQENLSSEEDKIEMFFSITNIPSLPVGQKQDVKLVLTNYRKPGPIKINIFADVQNPEFTDSETLIIAGLEMMGDNPENVRALVTYARDLLTSSPQCAELNDLLDTASRMLEQEQTQDALRLIDAAINGCNYLLSQEEFLRREQPGALKAGLDFTSQNWFEIIMGSVALIFIAITFYVFSFIRMSIKDNK